jgi:hypothetical protein
VVALKKRFTDTFEADDHIRQMEKLSYSSDISDYLTQMRMLNTKVRLTAGVSI